MKGSIALLLFLSLAIKLHAQAPIYTNRITTKSIYLLPVFSNDTTRLPLAFNANTSPGSDFPTPQELLYVKQHADALLTLLPDSVLSMAASINNIERSNVAGFLKQHPELLTQNLKQIGLGIPGLPVAPVVPLAPIAPVTPAPHPALPVAPDYLRKVNIAGGLKFQIVDKTASNYIIRLWNWNRKFKDPQRVRTADSLNRFYNHTPDSTQIYYALPLDQLDYLSDPLLERISVIGGVFAIPFKYRPQDGTFEPAFAVSGGAGLQFNRHSRDISTFTVLGAIGASTIQLTKFNATLPEGTDKLTTAGFTPSVSLIYQYKKLQIGLPIGIDFIFDNKTYAWKNQAKPWFALSLGVGIFTNSKPAEGTGQQ